MADFTDSSHNILYTLPTEKWVADLKMSGLADITGYQEAEGHRARICILDYCTAHNRGLYMPEGCGNPISWDLATFNPIRGEAGTVEVHKKHPTAKFEPARDVCWRGLVHLASRKKVLRINVHPVAGATKTPSQVTWGPELAAWKDWGLAQYFLDVLAFTAAQMSREYYDVILLAGDYNASLVNTGRWYYPSRMLPSLYEDDTHHGGGFDHLQHTHGSDVKVDKRWSVRGNSDHPLIFADYTFMNVPDYPKQ